MKLLRELHPSDWLRGCWNIELVPDERYGDRVFASYGLLVFRVFIGITWSRLR